jgi:hypothetical protein
MTKQDCELDCKTVTKGSHTTDISDDTKCVADSGGSGDGSKYLTTSMGGLVLTLALVMYM